MTVEKLDLVDVEFIRRTRQAVAGICLRADVAIAIGIPESVPICALGAEVYRPRPCDCALMVFDRWVIIIVGDGGGVIEGCFDGRASYNYVS